MTQKRNTQRVNDEDLYKLEQACRDHGFAVLGSDRKEMVGKDAMVTLYLRVKGFGAKTADTHRERDF